MKQAEDTKTLELPLAKRAGRPPKGAVAMTAAERQKQYRRRLQKEAGDAIGKVQSTGTAALIESLRQNLVALDQQMNEESMKVTRWAAGKLMREIATRYEIKL